MARILLVAQDSEEQSAVADAVRKESRFELLAVARGDHAVSEAVKGHYDLALVHTELPDIDGFEVCRRIQADARTGRLPVILLAGVARKPEGRQSGLASGASDFIVPPIDSLDLLARVDSVLRSRAHSDDVTRRNHELAEKVVERSRQLEDLAGELRIERDALRETFDVFQDGLLLIDGSGELLVGNTASRRLLDQPPDVSHLRLTSEMSEGAAGTLADVLAESSREAIRKNAPYCRTLVWKGRQLDVRVNPAAGGRALVYLRDVTE